MKGNQFHNVPAIFKMSRAVCCRPESVKRPLDWWKPTSGILSVANQFKYFGCPSDLISLRQYPCRSRAPFVSIEWRTLAMWEADGNPANSISIKSELLGLCVLRNDDLDLEMVLLA
jgi:hypothetical protein